jgi:hypothetical protein
VSDGYRAQILIGITGRFGTGKSTLAALLAEQLPGAQVVAFADALKADIHRLLHPVLDRPLALEEIERLKPTCLGPIYQGYGELLRQWYGADYWVGRLADALPARAIVADVRYPNEVDWLKHRGGQLIAVSGPNRRPDDTRSPDHPSEAFVEHCARRADVHLSNDGSLDSLRATAATLALAFKHAMEPPPPPPPPTPLLRALDDCIAGMRANGLEPVCLIMSRAKRRQLRDEITLVAPVEDAPEDLGAELALPYGLQCARYQGLLVSTDEAEPGVRLYGRDEQGRYLGVCFEQAGPPTSQSARADGGDTAEPTADAPEADQAATRATRSLATLRRWVGPRLADFAATLELRHPDDPERQAFPLEWANAMDILARLRRWARAGLLAPEEATALLQIERSLRDQLPLLVRLGLRLPDLPSNLGLRAAVAAWLDQLGAPGWAARDQAGPFPYRATRLVTHLYGDHQIHIAGFSSDPDGKDFPLRIAIETCVSVYDPALMTDEAISAALRASVQESDPR